MYGIGYQPAAQPAQAPMNFWNLISILAFDRFEMPAKPAWHPHIQPIMKQYGNLYPIMSRHLVDLGNYESVVAHLDILRFAFSRRIEDPNHMPVTRDLSNGKRDAILTWMDTPGDDGLPLKGEPAPAVAAAPAERHAFEVDLEPMQRRGKTAALMKAAARRARELQS